MTYYKELIGEYIGTFILVLFGCGAVASAVLLDAFGSLLEVAIIWGVGVAIAIFSVRNICPAHLNPAVSAAMALFGSFSIKKLPLYITSQFLGAFSAAALLYFIFGDTISDFEQTNSIVRGSIESMKTAQMFGEFFPNPEFASKISITALQAMALEAIGTFILVFVIFRLTEKEEQTDNLTPILIGLTVTLIICLVAPYTQAGINPARDFGPRLFAYLSGWGDAAFPTAPFSFFTVYILGPILGGIAAGGLNKLMT
ncbi:MAG: aquaporin family protein [Flavobacteriales bacterium]|jgi:glycerol uptake facilitator protein|nr:aquaporin family protein [Flavobacteriales bacterium]MBT6746147.1 aquaporin family protein [Flavobacteriales bacterium]